MTEFRYTSSSEITAATADVLQVMVTGYLEAAVFTESGVDDIQIADEFDPDSVACAFMICAGFLGSQGHIIAKTYNSIDDMAQVGRDIWLTQNRHGVGFWDRGLGEAGERLTDAARSLGEAYVTKGDNGLLQLITDWSGK